MKNLFNFNSLLVLTATFLSFESFASVKKTDCLHKVNTICRSMLKLHPTMDQKEAYKLSNNFARVAKKYKLDPKLLVSIAFQESAFKLDTIRKVTGAFYDEKADEFKVIKVGSDFCMMQIHLSNVKKMDLDIERLLNETDYCLEAGAKILAGYKKERSKDYKDWWTFYNAKTEEKRAIYHKHITRHLVKLEAADDSKRNIASQE